MRAPQEQTMAAACHLFNIIPIWGLIFCGWIWYAAREQSRVVVMHARQATAFHTALLAGGLVWMLTNLVCRLLNVISPSIGGVLSFINNAVMAVSFAAYVITCLIGAVRTLDGVAFKYPLVGMKE